MYLHAEDGHFASLTTLSLIYTQGRSSDVSTRRRWTLHFTDNSIANLYARLVQRAATITTASEQPIIFTVAGTPLAEQRSTEPPDDNDTEANSDEQSEEESDATSEDDRAEHQIN